MNAPPELFVKQPTTTGVQAFGGESEADADRCDRAGTPNGA
jgi:hypothetical protein